MTTIQSIFSPDFPCKRTNKNILDFTFIHKISPSEPYLKIYEQKLNSNIVQITSNLC